PSTKSCRLSDQGIQDRLDDAERQPDPAHDEREENDGQREKENEAPLLGLFRPRDVALQQCKVADVRRVCRIEQIPEEGDRTEQQVHADVEEHPTNDRWRGARAEGSDQQVEAERPADGVTEARYQSEQR